jgi:protein TonB
MIRPLISGRFFWGLALPEGRGRMVAVAVLVALLHVGLIWALVHGLAGGVVALVRDPAGPRGRGDPARTACNGPAPIPALLRAERGRDRCDGAQGTAHRDRRPAAAFRAGGPSGGAGCCRWQPDPVWRGPAGRAPGRPCRKRHRGGWQRRRHGRRGGASKPVKTAGDITAARDYPPQGRADRAGKRVIIVLRVGTDGHPTGCRIHAPSGNDEADAITCRLALQRFRFRPALDRDGNPVAADYGWEQRWWAP